MQKQKKKHFWISVPLPGLITNLPQCLETEMDIYEPFTRPLNQAEWLVSNFNELIEIKAETTSWYYH